MAKEMGDVTRFEEASRPRHAAVMIGILTAFELIYVYLFAWGLAAGWNSIEAQQILAFWLAMVFIILGIILMLYRRWFLDDVLVVKKRHPKFEDFLEK